MESDLLRINEVATGTITDSQAEQLPQPLRMYQGLIKLQDIQCHVWTTYQLAQYRIVCSVVQ